MSSELQIFTNPEFGQVRIVEIDGKPYAVGIDVARALGYKNPSKAVIQHCKEIVKSAIPTNGGKQVTNVISEDDIYRLVYKCQTKPAKYKLNFINWLIENSLVSEKKVILQTKKEIEFLNMLEEILKPFGFKCIRQYPVLKYRIDLYIENLNIAIEYDERSHKYYDDIKEKKRQEVIEQTLGCKFIRVSDENSNFWNCGYILKQIMEFKRFKERSKHERRIANL